MTYTASPALLGTDTFSGALSRVAGENVGTYAITLGSLSAGPNYSLSLSATTLNFTITPRPVTTKANDVTPVYGNSTPAFSIALTAGTTLASGDTLADLGTPVYGFDYVGDGVNVGTYPINVSGLANTNYTISYATGVNRGELTITPRPVTITPERPEQGLRQRRSDLDLHRQPRPPGYGYVQWRAQSRRRRERRDLRDHPGQPVGRSNYSLSLSATTVNFTITPRPVTIKANDVTRVYGNSTPAFSIALTAGTTLARVTPWPTSARRSMASTSR